MLYRTNCDSHCSCFNLEHINKISKVEVARDNTCFVEIDLLDKSVVTIEGTKEELQEEVENIMRIVNNSIDKKINKSKMRHIFNQEG